MSKPNEEDRVQKIEPLTSRSHFTTDAPSPAIRPRRRFPWLIAGPIVFGVLAVAVLITGYETDFFRYALIGYSKTPMTMEKAEQIASRGPPAGSSLDEVEAWLASQGLPSNGRASGPYYSVSRPGDDDASLNRLRDEGGSMTLAGNAALKAGEAHSYIRATYPDAERRPLGKVEITIYLFFDAKDQLIKHWVDLFCFAP